MYARGIGTISGHNGTDRTRGRKQVVKSSEPNVDAGKESKGLCKVKKIQKIQKNFG